jgi:hypothetical protein
VNPTEWLDLWAAVLSIVVIGLLLIAVGAVGVVLWVSHRRAKAYADYMRAREPRHIEPTTPWPKR